MNAKITKNGMATRGGHAAQHITGMPTKRENIVPQVASQLLTASGKSGVKLTNTMRKACKLGAAKIYSSARPLTRVKEGPLKGIYAPVELHDTIDHGLERKTALQLLKIIKKCQRRYAIAQKQYFASKSDQEKQALDFYAHQLEKMRDRAETELELRVSRNIQKEAV